MAVGEPAPEDPSVVFADGVASEAPSDMQHDGVTPELASTADADMSSGPEGPITKGAQSSEGKACDPVSEALLMVLLLVLLVVHERA